MQDVLSKVKEAVASIREVYDKQPMAGIILGTGLGALVDEVDVECEINYEDIPHFPLSTVEFHTGKLIFGNIAGKSVAVMQGRFHFYEGYTMQEVTFPVRVLKLLGIQYLFTSNAAGALNPEYATSDLMILEDHINLNYENPLTGKNLDELGDRFPDMFEPYSRKLIELAYSIGEEKSIALREGVYVSVPGPNLETRAEYRMLRMIGADAVGMSTVPEVIVACQMSLPVFAVSVITDLCSPDKLKKVKIEEILDAAKKGEPNMTLLMKSMIKKL